MTVALTLTAMPLTVIGLDGAPRVGPGGSNSADSAMDGASLMKLNGCPIVRNACRRVKARKEKPEARLERGATHRRIHSLAALSRSDPCRFESGGKPRRGSRAPRTSRTIRNVPRIRCVLCGLIGEEICLAPRARRVAQQA